MNLNNSSMAKVTCLIALLTTLTQCGQPPVFESNNVRQQIEESHTVQNGPQDSKESTDNQPRSCNRPLLISLGFTGYDKPQNQKLEMCNNITHSCCTETDQLNIFESWVQDLEEESLKKILDTHKEVYNKLLGLVYKTIDRAQTTSEFLAAKKTSNCKVLAKRVLHFDVKTIGPKLSEALDGMHKFFTTSYKGFYCMICDANMNPFISVKGNKFILSNKYCRDVTANTLHVLLYFHLHFGRYLNLVTRFVTSCNVKGVYRDVQPEGVPKFSVTPKLYNDLTNCKNYRNAPNWYDHCSHICKSFSMIKYDDYFAPNLKKFHRFNRFLTKQLDKLDKQAVMMKLLTEEKLKKTRLLGESSTLPTPIVDNKPDDFSAKQNEELQAFMEEMARFKDNPVVIKSAGDAIVDLNSFITAYEEIGIDPFVIGKNTNIDPLIVTRLRRNQQEAQDKKDSTKSQKVEMEGGEDESGVIIYRWGWFLVIAMMYLYK